MEAKVDRCPTGVPGLDELIEGGLPRGRVVLLAGDCGTGKSILATQFLVDGAVKYNEPGILVSLEQSPEHLKEDMLAMGMDLDKLEKEKKIIIIDASLSGMAFNTSKSEYTLTPEQFSIDSIIALIDVAAKKIKAKRAVVDSFSALDSLIESKKTKVGMALKEDVRRSILEINYKLQAINLTSILISDIIDEGHLSKHGVEEFMVDGVITLHYSANGADAGRHLIIKKMRNTKHSENIHTIEFVSGKGVKIVD